MASSVLSQEEQPISRTYQYRKVMKPMLERKRRARINRCLDELKELLVGALQAEGESVSRLEKADVLELTVRHLHKLRRSQQLSENAAIDRYRAGFSHCANEVAKYVSSVPSSMDITISARLLSHLDGCLHRPIDSAGVNHRQTLKPPRSSPIVINNYTPPSSPQAPSALSPGQQPSPAHLQTPYRQMAYHQQQLAASLQGLTSVEEPFDLSSGSVWRPW